MTSHQNAWWPHRRRVWLTLAAGFSIGAVLLEFGLPAVAAQAMVPDTSARGSAAPAGRALESAQGSPAFRAGVDLLTFDVQVVAAAGTFGPPLKASQFEVKIAGRGRTIVMIEFLHADEGQITRGNSLPSVDQATRAVCVFGFDRVSNRAHGHYLVSVESIARDKHRVEHPRIKSLDRSVSVRRFAWRSRMAPAGAAP
jgi:hypothetical protein